MAYNVLKGIVEGSVDQHADQEIGGVKIFKNTISASVFYDTDAQSPCATMKDVAITNIKGGVHNSILICDKDEGARSHYNFTFDGNALRVHTIISTNLEGSLSNAINIPSDKFTGRIPADFINHGPGIQNIRGQLQVNFGDGLKCEDDQLELSLGIKSGLSHVGRKLVIDPAKTEPINLAGQNLADNDILIVSDVSKGTTNGTTLANLYKNYIAPRTPHAAGNKNEIQFKGGAEFESSPKLTFNSAAALLNVEGKIRTDTAYVEGSLVCGGSVIHNIIKTAEKVYEIRPDDYTVLCDTDSNKMTVKLPPACNNVGRVLVIKKADSNKYKITSNILTILSDEGRIDIGDKLIIKMNYSSRTLQSDGENWWLIGSKGS